MFGIGSTELLVILVVALLVLGPKNLPKMAQTLGRAMGEFRRVSTEFQRTLNTEIAFEEHAEKKREADKELFGEKDAQAAATAPSTAATAASAPPAEGAAAVATATAAAAPSFADPEILPHPAAEASGAVSTATPSTPASAEDKA